MTDKTTNNNETSLDTATNGEHSIENGNQQSPTKVNNNHTPIKLQLKIKTDFNDEQQKNEKNAKSFAQDTDEATSAPKKKKKRRDKSDLGDDFVAPDGGWGWVVAIAGGLNILVTFAVAQQFGIIFRQRMLDLGITNSELTTIINTQVAVSALTGLLNGPLFRRYTYRVVAIVGSFLTFFGLFLSVFAASFIFYVCAFSILYGFGRGLTVSASSLAVNTYFKQKRRTATAYQFGVAGMGPIFLPYLATALLDMYLVQGTVLIFSAISLHTVACSLIYQPVQWHVKKRDADAEALNKEQNPYDEEEEFETVVEPETPVLPRANDGWYGSRTSLNSLTHRSRVNTLERRRDSSAHTYELKRLNSKDLGRHKPRSISISASIKEEDNDENEYMHQQQLTDKQKQEQAANMKVVAQMTQAEMEAIEDEERKRLPFHKKVVIFFDLDLLRDITYVNLAVGLTLINFVEINFAILTPMILADFGFNSGQIAFAMSSLGFCDLVVRFLVPLITAKIPYSNKTFFIIGIIGMCIGRTLLSFTRDFYLMIAIFLWMGLNKGFRTVFWSLIIPGYVPLKRLPAAAGLQLLMSGVFSMAFGPLIGLIRDVTNYAFTLNFLNSLCVIAISLWLLEDVVRSRRRKSSGRAQDIN